MRLLIILFIATSFSACATTEPDPIQAEKELAERIERCRKLKQQREDLKGKPVRRNAADQYYRDECLNLRQP